MSLISCGGMAMVHHNSCRNMHDKLLCLHATQYQWKLKTLSVAAMAPYLEILQEEGLERQSRGIVEVDRNRWTIN